MANSILSTTAPGYGESGNLALALPGKSLPLSLSRVFGHPLLSRSPDYVAMGLTDNSTIFTVWDSNDPLNNSNAAVAGVAYAPLAFPANTLTPVVAKIIFANDDTIGWMTAQCLVKGSATAPVLAAAFLNEYQLKATFSSGTATRVVAESSPGLTITGAAVATGRYAIAFPACKAIHIACGLDSAAATVATAALHAQPNAIVTASGTGEIRMYGAATPALTAPGDTHILHVKATLRETVGYLDRFTQDDADVQDARILWDINTTPAPDSLILRVTGIGTTKFKYRCGIWVGDPMAIDFRSQS